MSNEANWDILSEDEKRMRTERFRKLLRKEHVKALFPEMDDKRAKEIAKRLRK